jgi:hypothetical protein
MPSSNQTTETTMTLGNILYLAMAVGVFGLFSAVLAYETWWQSRTESKLAPARVAHAEPGNGVRA